MKVLFDTSVLVAALVLPHEAHERSWAWLKRAGDHEIEMMVSAHSLAELYGNLSKLPVSPRLAPEAVAELIGKSVEAHATVVALSAADYSNFIRRMARLGLSGAIVYDGLIACAAEQARVDQLLTLNPRDFRRVWPEGAAKIVTP